MNRNRKNKGFTLIEIMIVVLIIGILMAIAVPNFIHARSNSRLSAIQANLKQIDQGKEQMAMEKGMKSGDAVANSDLTPTYLKAFPSDNVPVTGAYLSNAIGANPTFGGNDSAWWVLHCKTTPDSSCTL